MRVGGQARRRSCAAVGAFPGVWCHPRTCRQLPTAPPPSSPQVQRAGQQPRLEAGPLSGLAGAASTRARLLPAAAGAGVGPLPAGPGAQAAVRPPDLGKALLDQMANLYSFRAAALTATSHLSRATAAVVGGRGSGTAARRARQWIPGNHGTEQSQACSHAQSMGRTLLMRPLLCRAACGPTWPLPPLPAGCGEGYIGFFTTTSAIWGAPASRSGEGGGAVAEGRATETQPCAHAATTGAAAATGDPARAAGAGSRAAEAGQQQGPNTGVGALARPLLGRGPARVCILARARSGGAGARRRRRLPPPPATARGVCACMPPTWLLPACSRPQPQFRRDVIKTVMAQVADWVANVPPLQPSSEPRRELIR